MSQARVRVTTAGRGFVFMEPKPSLQYRHGLRLTNGVVEILPNQAFDVVANFSRQERQLPKHTVVGYAKRNSLAILTPERRVAEGIADALHFTDLTDQVGEAGVGRPSSAERTTVEKGVSVRTTLRRSVRRRRKALYTPLKRIPKIRRRIGKKKSTCHTSTMTSSVATCLRCSVRTGVYGAFRSGRFERRNTAYRSKRERSRYVRCPIARGLRCEKWSPRKSTKC